MARKPKNKTLDHKTEKSANASEDCTVKIPDAPILLKSLSTCSTPGGVNRESTDQIRLERDFFKEVISAVSHPFYAIDANNYKVLMANQAAINLFGDLSQYPFCYSWTHGRPAPCAGTDHPCPLEMIKKTKKPLVVEHIHYDNQNRPLNFQIHAYPLLDPRGNVSQIIEYTLEITKFKRMESALWESETKYRNILESIEDGYYEVDRSGNMSFFNDSLCKIFGYSDDELIGMNFSQYMDQEFAQKVFKTFNQVFLTGKPEKALDWQIKRKDGDKRWIESSVSAITDEEGGFTGFRGIIRDVTDRKIAEEKLATYSKHLERIVAELNVAQEVQQNLLPRSPPRDKCCDIAGTSLYCDETGGDYYDYMKLPWLGNNVHAIVVGDVSGHGVASALLMASVRAYLRGRVLQPGSLSEILTDVNRLVSADTLETGQFMTLFFLAIDAQTGGLTWIRAGHYPALLYSPFSGCCGELGGEGLPLGVTENWEYTEYTATAKPGEIFILTTDGVWEAQNDKGDMFGKEKFEKLIGKNADLGAEDIRESIIEAVTAFQGKTPQDDDITLVVLKYL